MKLKSLLIESNKINQFKALLSKYDGWAIMSDDSSKQKIADRQENEMAKLYMTMTDSEKKAAMDLFNSKSTFYKKFNFDAFDRFMNKKS